MQILISIIIPVYNVEKYIKECLDSIIKQNIKDNIEIICVDDGSTDKSGLICDKYAKLDKRFVVVHQKNKGVSAARNLGIKIAKGKYIGWIDPDDYINNNWWENIKNILKNDIDVLFFDYTVLINGEYKEKKFSYISGYISKQKFLKEITIDRRLQNQLWQKIFKRNLIKDIFFPENISLMEDYAVLHKIILKAEKIYYISKNLYVYRVRENSLVTELSIEKNYKAFLIAKERYVFLLNNNINVPKIGYLMRALNVCVQYYKVNKNEKNKNRKMYLECKRELDSNKKYIFNYTDCDIKIRIKFILYRMNILNLLIYIKKTIKFRR